MKNIFYTFFYESKNKFSSIDFNVTNFELMFFTHITDKILQIKEKGCIENDAFYKNGYISIYILQRTFFQSHSFQKIHI